MIHLICTLKFFPSSQLAEPRAIGGNTDKTYETTAQRDSS
jgi:hypothetical protein